MIEWAVQVTGGMAGMCCCICIRSVLLLLPALKLGSQSLCSRSSLSLKCSNHIVMKRGSTQHSQPEMFKSYSYEKWFHSAQSYTVPEHTSDHDQYAHAYTHTYAHIFTHTYIYKDCLDSIQPFWISREPDAWAWCNLAAKQRTPYCASMNSHSPVGLVSGQWDADDWACVLSDHCIHNDQASRSNTAPAHSTALVQAFLMMHHITQVC